MDIIVHNKKEGGKMEPMNKEQGEDKLEFKKIGENKSKINWLLILKNSRSNWKK